MAWSYPRLTVGSYWKLVVILLCEVALYSGVLFTAILCTWRSEKWNLLNGHTLDWQLGLYRIGAGANCDAVNEPQFHAICMAIFKSSFGTIGQVRDFFCNLNTADIKIEPEFLEDARVFSGSCHSMRSLYSISMTTLVMLILVSVLITVVIVMIIGLSYKQFKQQFKNFYWMSFIFQLISCFILFGSIFMYWKNIGAVVPSVFNYVDEAHPGRTIIQSTPNGGSFRYGFHSAVFLLLLDVIVAVMILCWVPIARQETQMVKKGKGPAKKKKKGETQGLMGDKTQTSFWAFMPEIFQPDVYVAEYGPQEVMG